MTLRITLLILFAAISAAYADQLVQNAQQALKDQGFYYGEVNGDKDADTTAAIRRYQIRNGLQITGELNEETLKSLGADANHARTSAQTPPTPAPSSSDLRLTNRLSVCGRMI